MERRTVVYHVYSSRISFWQSPWPAKGPLPKLQTWTFARESPEVLSTFDDSQWKAASKQSTNNPLPQPAGQPVLYASDYGYHIGHIWYRGTFQASGDEASLNITAQGMFDVFTLS